MATEVGRQKLTLPGKHDGALDVGSDQLRRQSGSDEGTIQAARGMRRRRFLCAGLAIGAGLAALGAGGVAPPPWAQDPGMLVKEFIRDYRAWNDGAFARSQAGSTGAAMDAAETAWRKLLLKFCPPGFRGEPIAFGSRSLHDLVSEEILSTHIRGDDATIRTRTRHIVAGTQLADDYEYVLHRHGRRWFLLQVNYLVDGEKYPALWCPCGKTA